MSRAGGRVRGRDRRDRLLPGRARPAARPGRQRAAARRRSLVQHEPQLQPRGAGPPSPPPAPAAARPVLAGRRRPDGRPCGVGERLAVRRQPRRRRSPPARPAYFSDVDRRGSRVPRADVPVGVSRSSSGPEPAALQLARPLGRCRQRPVASLRLVLLLVCAGGIALAAALGRLAARRVLAPLAEVAADRPAHRGDRGSDAAGSESTPTTRSGCWPRASTR